MSNTNRCSCIPLGDPDGLPGKRIVKLFHVRLEVVRVDIVPICGGSSLVNIHERIGKNQRNSRKAMKSTSGQPSLPRASSMASQKSCSHVMPSGALVGAGLPSLTPYASRRGRRYSVHSSRARVTLMSACPSCWGLTVNQHMFVWQEELTHSLNARICFTPYASIVPLIDSENCSVCLSPQYMGTNSRSSPRTGEGLQV